MSVTVERDEKIVRCLDCKWYQYKTNVYRKNDKSEDEFHRCTRPILVKTDYVTGTRSYYPNNKPCNEERYTNCSTDPRYPTPLFFEPKE